MQSNADWPRKSAVATSIFFRLCANPVSAITAIWFASIKIPMNSLQLLVAFSCNPLSVLLSEYKADEDKIFRWFLEIFKLKFRHNYFLLFFHQSIIISVRLHNLLNWSLFNIATYLGILMDRENQKVAVLFFRCIYAQFCPYGQNGLHPS